MRYLRTDPTEIGVTPMSLLMILLTIFLPPVAVAMKEGIGGQFLLNLLLTLIGWFPGVVHAFWINSRGNIAA